MSEPGINQGSTGNSHWISGWLVEGPKEAGGSDSGEVWRSESSGGSGVVAGTCLAWIQRQLVGLLLSNVDHDCLSQAILGTHPISIPEELQEPQTQLQHRSAIAQSAFNGLPEAHAVACKR